MDVSIYWFYEGSYLRARLGGVNMLAYILKIILVYSFIFAGIFHLTRWTKPMRNSKLSTSLATLLIIFIFACLQGVRFGLHWMEIPDGRYLLLVFAAYYLGVIPMLCVLGVMGVSIYLIAPTTVVGFTGILAIMGFLFVYFGNRLYRQSRAIGTRHIWIGVLLIVIIPIVLSNILLSNQVYVALANKNLVGLTLLVYVLVFTICSAVNKELERIAHVEIIEADKLALQQQNNEIQALYEEMYATDEVLRANYDDLEAYKNKVEFYAFHEAKTGLMNKEGLLKILKEASNASDFKPFFIISISICDLHDTLEKIGQTLIEIVHQEVAQDIKSALDGTEACLYSLSYGHYALIIHGEDLGTLENLVNRIRENSKQVEIVEASCINVSLAVGGVQVIEANVDPLQQLENADVAMYEASAINNRHMERLEIIWFSDELLQNKKYASQIELDLKHALALDEFFLVYQPQYDRTCRVIGAEALLRWRHNKLGLISPAVFIPIAEKLGIIGSIGLFVIRSVMEELSNGKHVPIAINASFLELMNPNYAKEFIELLQTYHVEPKYVHLEITESAISNQIMEVTENLDQLSRLGIEIHLDDFGTGYSSLSHLSHFPVNVIKIDKVFVKEMTTNPSDKVNEVVRSMIDLSHRLNIRVIAEGVETQEQFELLKEMPCDAYQGFLFSKPLVADLWHQMSLTQNIAYKGDD